MKTLDWSVEMFSRLQTIAQFWSYVHKVGFTNLGSDEIYTIYTKIYLEMMFILRPAFRCITIVDRGPRGKLREIKPQRSDAVGPTQQHGYGNDIHDDTSSDL